MVCPSIHSYLYEIFMLSWILSILSGGGTGRVIHETLLTSSFFNESYCLYNSCNLIQNKAEYLIM